MKLTMTTLMKLIRFCFLVIHGYFYTFRFPFNEVSSIFIMYGLTDNTKRRETDVSRMNFKNDSISEVFLYYNQEKAKQEIDRNMHSSAGNVQKKNATITPGTIIVFLGSY